MDWRGALLNDHDRVPHLKEELPCGRDVWRGFQVLLWVLQDATLGLPHLRRHRADACKNTREMRSSRAADEGRIFSHKKEWKEGSYVNTGNAGWAVQS